MVLNGIYCKLILYYIFKQPSSELVNSGVNKKRIGFFLILFFCLLLDKDENAICVRNERAKNVAECRLNCLSAGQKGTHGIRLWRAK